jgi:hypothetical protein
MVEPQVEQGTLRQVKKNPKFTRQIHRTGELSIFFHNAPILIKSQHIRGIHHPLRACSTM